MAKESKAPAADSKRKEAIKGLTNAATAFARNPFDARAICEWYMAFGDHCPLWALQERAYHKLIGTRRNRLRVNHAWAVMREASYESLREPNFLWSTDMLDFDFRVLDPATGTVAKPPNYANHSAAPKYLVHAYSSVLVRPLRSKSLSEVLKPETLRIPDDYAPDPDDLLLDFADEIWAELDLLDELRSLIVARDLARKGDDRHRRQRELDGLLRTLGIKPKAGNPSIPKAEALVEFLTEECRAWLPAERACQSTTPSESALESLNLWGCSSDPQFWVERMAFPFLTSREVAFLRGKKRPTDDRLTAVYLIHCRVRDFLNLCTTADYALGDRVKVQLLPGCWRGGAPRNPLCPS